MTERAAPLLSLRGVAKRRESAGARFELRVESLDVAAGERVALVGESGSGKSTLLDLLALASAPDDAEAFALATADGATDAAALWRDGDGDALAALRARHVGYVPQTGGLFAFLNVFDNIDLPRRLLGMADDGTTAALARRLGVADHLRKKPAALSVGQRQRVAIARALAHGPALVLADEPTASVDPATADLVTELLLEQTAERGAALILASHDWARIERLGLPRVAPEIERRRDGDGVVVRSVFARTS
ncbi:MAG: ABC transporter ATP-binding protein [Rhodospirillales bacterium]|nr:ABC transporter ATP-binding protein [Rhodospirillales bacterium]